MDFPHYHDVFAPDLRRKPLEIYAAEGLAIPLEEGIRQLRSGAGKILDISPVLRHRHEEPPFDLVIANEYGGPVTIQIGQDCPRQERNATSIVATGIGGVACWIDTTVKSFNMACNEPTPVFLATLGDQELFKVLYAQLLGLPEAIARQVMAQSLRVQQDSYRDQRRPKN